MTHVKNVPRNSQKLQRTEEVRFRSFYAVKTADGERWREGKKQSVKMDLVRRGATSSKRFRSDSIDAYAVQCGKCFKWRLIETQEEYETIRENFIEDPWFCSKKLDASCDDPGDLEYDTSRLWIIDKPNIPKTPHGLSRNLVMRNDFSKLDVNYDMPNGKKVRCPGEVERFLKANPQYKGQFSSEKLNFATPKILEDMVPHSIGRSSKISNKKVKKFTNEDN